MITWPQAPAPRPAPQPAEPRQAETLTADQGEAGDGAADPGRVPEPVSRRAPLLASAGS